MEVLPRLREDIAARQGVKDGAVLGHPDRDGTRWLPRRARLAGRVMAALLAAGLFTVGAAAAAETLRGQLVLVVKGGLKETPDKLVEEISDHIRARIQTVSIANVLKGGDGRIILEVTFAADRKLAFEKMVAELPAVGFIVPVTVEGWNVKPGVDPAAGGGDHDAPRQPEFDMTLSAKRDTISSLNFKEVPLRDVLSYLGQQMNLEYICPGEIGRRLVTAQLRNVTLAAFLEGLKLGLDIGIRKVGGFYVFSARADIAAGPRRPAGRPAEGAH